MTGRAIILRGDAAHLPLPDASVDLIVTSPPYWGLRSYTDGGQHYSGQIGDEPTPWQYLDNLINCTAEWARVLKPSGSIFVNLGDAFANTATPDRDGPSDGATCRATRPGRRSSAGTGIRPKSLYGLPWRYAIACVDKLGLIQRRDIVWEKPTAIPESVTDRCRTTHEYLFHFTLSERYYAATDRIRLPSNPDHHRNIKPRTTHNPGQSALTIDRSARNPLGALPGSVWRIAAEPLVVPDHVAHATCCDGNPSEGCEDGLRHHAAFPTALPRLAIEGWSPVEVCTACGEGRRPWVDRGPPRGDFVAGQDRLLAGRSSNGSERNRVYRERREAGIGARILGEVCSCAPRTDHPGTGERHPNGGGAHGNHRPDGDGPGSRPSNLAAAERVGPWREYHLDDWAPPPTTPGVVLDPFGGTGTTALVASALGRIGITVDRSADYGRLARWRTTDPGQIAKVRGLPKPKPQADGQLGLFDNEAQGVAS